MHGLSPILVDDEAETGLSRVPVQGDNVTHETALAGTLYTLVDTSIRLVRARAEEDDEAWRHALEAHIAAIGAAQDLLRERERKVSA